MYTNTMVIKLRVVIALGWWAAGHSGCVQRGLFAWVQDLVLSCLVHKYGLVTIPRGFWDMIVAGFQGST